MIPRPAQLERIRVMTKTEKMEVLQRRRAAHHVALETLAKLINPAAKASGLELWRKLNRLGREAHAGATAYCNGETINGYKFGQDENAWENFSAMITAKVSKILGGIPAGFFVNGDARGYALKIHPPIEGVNLEKDWGGNQLLAPVIDLENQ